MKTIKIWGPKAPIKPLNNNNMYKKTQKVRQKIRVNKSKQGETIEQKIERIVNNKEPIKDGAPLIYTERKEGIRASTNIRTDRFDIAIMASEKVAKSYKAKREERAKSRKIGETEPTQGKAEDGTSKAANS